MMLRRTVYVVHLSVALNLLCTVDAGGSCWCKGECDVDGNDCNKVIKDLCAPGLKCNCNVKDVLSSGTSYWCFSDPYCEADEEGSSTVDCAPGTSICDDPHLAGLRGQRIDVSGVDGGWYCLVRDDEMGFQANVRLTAPLPEEYPNRQVATGLAIRSDHHTLVVEARDPHDLTQQECLEEDSPCLVNGAIRVLVDGVEEPRLLRPTRNEVLAHSIEVSASNLPVECQQFGGDRLWARMYQEMLDGVRILVDVPTFEEWVLSFERMAAPDWCAKYVSEHGLQHVRSNHAAFRISTQFVEIRLLAGANHQDATDRDWDGRALPELDFWQMDVGFEGLLLDSVQLTGILGETARPVLDEEGMPILRGDLALRGDIEDYRVSDKLGTDFALLQK